MKCLCQLGGSSPSSQGGGLDGGGAFGLILLFGLIFFVPIGYFCGRPERARELGTKIKGMVPGSRRAQTGATTTAGLAGNDSYATSYVTPTVPVAAALPIGGPISGSA